MEGGIVPVNRLSCNDNNSSDDNDASEPEIVNDNLLSNRYNEFNSVKNPIEAGIDPVN